MGRPKGSKNKPKSVPTSTKNIVRTSNSTNTNTPRTMNTIKPTIETPKGLMTASDMKEKISKYDFLKETFAATRTALQVADLTKSENRTFSTFNREVLRTYLKNPKSYEDKIRNLSRYLFRLCYEYRRICYHYAYMICGDAFNIYSLFDITKAGAQSKIYKNYYDTAYKWEKMDLKNQLLQLLVVAWREDTVYAYVYDDSDQDGGTCFFHILDGDYCKIQYLEDGVPRFAFDFSYFRSHQSELEFWDKEFKTKYEKYLSDSSLRWQGLESDRQICLKVNIEDPTMSYPPFTSIFEKIIDLIDLQSIQSVRDQLSIYKLLVARLKPLNGTDQPDDFEVDIDTAIEYFNKISDSLPDYVDAVVSPLPLDTIEFKDLNTTEGDDMLSSSMKNIFKSIGGQILDNDKTGSSAFEAQTISDMLMGQSTLLPQLERWINIYLDYSIGTDHARVVYISGISPFTRDKVRDALLAGAQNGFSTKVAIAILMGMTPLQFICQLYMENEAMGLLDKMIPLSTSYTKSGNEAQNPITGGAPNKDNSNLTDSGSKTKENK